jgi:hypothetical protein
MDYTKISRYLIYQDKKDIEYFVDNEESLDNLMIQNIEDTAFVHLPGAPEYVLEIYNTAYYITTLILLEKRPILHLSSYFNIAGHIAAAPGHQNSFHKLFECISMAMICNYLQVLQPKQLDYDVFYSNIEDYFRRYDSTYTEHFFHILLDEMTVHDYVVYPDRFLPRPIIDALKESSKEDIINNIDYIKTRIMELEDGSRELAAKLVFDKIDLWIKNNDSIPLSTEERKVIVEMKELFDNDSKITSEEFEKKMDDYMVRHIITKEDIDQAISDDNNNSTTDEKRSESNASLDARIKELVKENERLKEQLTQKPTAVENTEAMDSLKKENQRISKEHEEMIVELLIPIFYNSEQDVKEFLEKIDGRPDTEIIDTVCEFSKARKLSDKSKGRPLWSVLHAAKYYSSTESNWNTALRNHP